MANGKIYHHEVDSHGADHFFLKGKCFRMTEDDVALICQNYNIPRDYRTRLPYPEENCVVDVEKGWMNIHEASFHLGFHLPLHNFGLRFLHLSGLALG